MGADSAPLVVSTHSTVFLDHKNPERTQTYLVRRVESAASLSKGRRPRRRGPSARRHSLSDVASAERVLLVEGDSDVAVLNAWFGSKLVRHGIAVVPMDGGDKASHTETVIRVLQQADTLDRRVVFLRERDELSDESAAKLDASGNVHLLARRELENYLLEPDAVAQVLNLGRLDASASNRGLLRLVVPGATSANLVLAAAQLTPGLRDPQAATLQGRHASCALPQANTHTQPHRAVSTNGPERTGAALAFGMFFGVLLAWPARRQSPG